MWLTKTCRVTPSVENFVRVGGIHYEQKTISVRGPDGHFAEMEPQYGCHTFAFQQNCLNPIAASKNKWPEDWAFY
jgi:hypothetical protein